ncbi:hypothetical protein DDN80_16045 [Vibrio cholerae]|nr:hypothetical protein [Vibrio cholerae]EKF9234442.1 hypothetical protein [Vibrio cholerae]HCJ6893377.1 hypothetical protein [Vibrio cholerae]
MKQIFTPLAAYIGATLPYCAAIAVIYGGYHLIEENNQQRTSSLIAEVQIAARNVSRPITAATPTNEPISNNHVFRTPQEILADIEKLQDLAGGNQ